MKRQSPHVPRQGNDTARAPRILLRDRITDDLRENITTGIYAPGDRLPSLRVLAAQYEVSTQPVRRAIHTLRDEGLVDIIGNTGVYTAATENTPPVQLPRQPGQR